MKNKMFILNSVLQNYYGYYTRKSTLNRSKSFYLLCRNVLIVMRRVEHSSLKKLFVLLKNVGEKRFFFTIIPRARAIVVFVRKKLLFMGRGPEMKRCVYKAFAKVVAAISFKAENRKLETSRQPSFRCMQITSCPPPPQRNHWIPENNVT